MKIVTWLNSSFDYLIDFNYLSSRSEESSCFVSIECSHIYCHEEKEKWFFFLFVVVEDDDDEKKDDDDDDGEEEEEENG